MGGGSEGRVYGNQEYLCGPVGLEGHWDFSMAERCHRGVLGAIQTSH